MFTYMFAFKYLYTWPGLMYFGLPIMFILQWKLQIVINKRKEVGR